MSVKALQLISKKKKTSHLLHLILSVITMGFWLPVWALVTLSNGIENARIDAKINKLED